MGSNMLTFNPKSKLFLGICHEFELILSFKYHSSTHSYNLSNECISNPRLVHISFIFLLNSGFKSNICNCDRKYVIKVVLSREISNVNAIQRLMNTQSFYYVCAL